MRATDTPALRAGNLKAMRATRDETKFRAWVDQPEAALPSVYDRPSIVSASGRTVGFLDAAGFQTIAEEHEWMRDRVVRLELENALLRSVLDVSGIRPVVCEDAATT